MTDIMIAGSRVAPDAQDATIRQIDMHDLKDALAAGWSDFLTIPTQLVFLCILYPVVGMVAARAAVGHGLIPLLFPLVAGISLLGPVLAVGIYELSRRREQGLQVSWLNALDVRHSPAMLSIAAIGVLLLGIFTTWLAVARAIYEHTVGAAAGLVANQGADSGMLFWGNLAGLLVVLLALGVFTVPMLLNRAGLAQALVIRPSARALTAVGALLLGVSVAWLSAASATYENTIGALPPEGFMHQVMRTGAGPQMIFWGNLAGFAFAVIVLALTVISVPMLLDRPDTSPGMAIRTSVRAVAANPAMMAAWGLIVALTLALGCVPLFIGLAVAIPVLGHATWHLYRKVVV